MSSLIRWIQTALTRSHWATSIPSAAVTRSMNALSVDQPIARPAMA